MSRQSIAVRLGRLVQRLPLSLLRFLERPFVRSERAISGHAPMIILLALPRGGSTLAYQALVHALAPVYLTNLWNMFYALPLFGGLLSRLRCHGHRSEFRSSQGFVEGLCGPAEGLKFWGHWFGQHLDEVNSTARAAEVPPSRPLYLKRVLATLCRVDRPFVTGYIGHALAVPSLNRMFPEAVFVRLTREPLDNALSIFDIRKRSPLEPFSVRPHESDARPGDSLHRQVAAQVHYLNRRIDADLDASRTIEVSYEQLCADPNRELARIIDYCNERGFRLSLRQRLPDKFNASIAGDAVRNSNDAKLLERELAAFEFADG